MDMKIWAAALAVIGMVGAAFAFGGFGAQPGNGLGQSMGMESGAKNAAGIMKNNVSDEVRILFMKAVHEGDYASAKSISEEYGIGGRMIFLGSEEGFSLRYQAQQAMDSGDYAKALELQKQMQELRLENAPQGMGRAFRQGMHAGFKAGMGAGMNAGREGCPFAEPDETAPAAPDEGQ